MTVVYNTTLINTRLQDVVDAIDAGSGHGFLFLTDSVGTTLSSLELSKPCGSVSGGVLQFLGLSLIDPAAVASGDAVAARVEDSDGNAIITGLTVGAGSTSEIILSPSNAITAGDTVAITAATITGH